MAPPYPSSATVTHMLCASDSGFQGIKGEVEVQDVDPWFAEESEGASLRVLGDRGLDLCQVQAAYPGHAGDLFLGVGGADVGVEPGPAGQQRVWWDLAGVDAVQGCGSCPTRVDVADQDLVLRAEVGRAAGGGVVSCPGRGRAALEVLGVGGDHGVAGGVFGGLAVLQDGNGEALADQGGADGGAAAGYQGAVGVVVEGDLGEAGHDQRVGQAEDDGQQEQGS